MQTEQIKVYRSDSPQDKRTVCASQVPNPAPDSRTEVVEQDRAAERKAKASPPFEPTSAEKAATLLNVLDGNSGNSVSGQCSRFVLAAAAAGEVSCMEAQCYLDIRCPPARVLELRKAGYSIADRWIRQTSERGHIHRTKAYFLVGKPATAEVGVA